MIGYPAVKHRLPAQFVRKIAVDRAIALLCEAKVVRLLPYQAVKGEQAQCRYSCAESCKPGKSQHP